MNPPTESTTAGSEVLSASLQSDERLDDAMESTQDKGETVQYYVLDNPPPELKWLRNHEAVIESSLQITSNHFTIGRFLPRGGIIPWFSKEVALLEESAQPYRGGQKERDYLSSFSLV